MADIARLGIRVDSSGAVRATSDLKKLEKQGGQTEKAVTVLKNAAIGLAAAFSVRELVRYADAYTSIQNQLRLVTGSTQDLLDVQSQLLEIANQGRADFQATAELYTVITRNTTELGLSQTRLLRVTDLINKSFAVTGADAATAAGAIRQLSQGLAAGALRGEEFNSVAEGAPEILRAIREETGKTQAELRDFAATGGITAELIIRSLENYGDTLDDIFEKSQRTFGQSIQVARNNFTQFAGELNESTGALAGLGDAVVGLSNNLDKLVVIGQAVAAIYGARLVGSTVAYTGALAAQTTAALTATTAVSSLNARMGLVAPAASAATIATNGLTIAVRGLSTALAFLGGPAGLLFLAAAGLVIYAQRAQQAAGATNQFFNEVDKQNRLDELSEKLKTAEARLDKLRTTAQGFAPDVRAYSGIDDKIADTEQRISELRIEMEKVANTDIIGKVEELATATGSIAGESDKAKKSLEDLLQTLTQQTDTMGMTEAQVLAYRLSLGDLSDEVRALGASGDVLAQSIVKQAEALEASKTAEQYREVNTAMADQISLMRMSERAAFAQQAVNNLSADATAYQIQQTRTMAGTLFDERQAQELANKQKQEAAQILESLKQPTDIYIDQLAKIKELEEAGALTSVQAENARLQAIENLAEASRQGLGDITTFAEEASRNIQNLFADNLFDFMQGEFEFTGDSFKKMIDRMMAEALAADFAGALFGGASGVPGVTGSGLLGKLASSVGSAFGFGGGSSVASIAAGTPSSIPTLSFDGGGYTGSGSRSGGMDGKGGFPAMLHPQETVVDHSKGQSMGVTVNVNVSGMRDSADLRRSASQIAQQAGAAANRALSRNG